VVKIRNTNLWLKKDLEKACNLGWENWSPVINGEELTLIHDDEEFRDFVRRVE
jgi:hypothetical protein